MTMMTGKVLNDQQLVADLASLGRGMRGQALRSALRAAASPVVKRAKADSPSARVSRSLTANVSGSDLEAQALIGARRKSYGGRILHFIEKGTRPHRIAPRKARALKIGDRYIRGAVNHPGARAHPFFLAALPLELGEVERKFGSAIRQIVAKMQLKMLTDQAVSDK